MFEGFDLAGCVRVEIVRCGFTRDTEVTVVTLRVHRADGRREERTADLGGYGVNYETLVEFVRRANAELRRSAR